MGKRGKWREEKEGVKYGKGWSVEGNMRINCGKQRSKAVKRRE